MVSSLAGDLFCNSFVEGELPIQGQEIRAGRVSEREGVQRGGGECDNMTVVPAKRHVQLSDGVIVRRTDAYHP